MNEHALVSLVDNLSGSVALNGVRDKITAIEEEFRKHPQVDIPVIHRYSGGIYAREITIPKGTLLTGRIYKDAHFDVMVSGDVTVTSDEGKKRLTGFNVFEGKQGKKRAGYAHEDTRWITFHVSDELEEGEYLAALTCESFEDYDSQLIERDYIKEEDIITAFSEVDCDDYKSFRVGYLLMSGKPSKIDLDRLDYAVTLNEYGFTEDIARSQSENQSDRVEIESICKVLPSDIEGLGLYSSKDIPARCVIMPARIEGKRTIAGRYTNHSFNPNATIVMLPNGDMDLVSLKAIGSEEITINYRTALSLQIDRVK